MSAIQKRNYSLTEACEALGIRRTTAYREMSVGRLRYVKCGRRTLIPAESIDAYCQLLNSEAEVRRANQEGS